MRGDSMPAPNVQFITTPGGGEMAVLPRADYDAMVAALEERVDVAEAQAILARVQAGEEETFPGDLVARMVAGENAIKLMREHRGMTQAALADAAGTSTAYISQLETNRRKPGLDLARRIAGALRVDFDTLFPEGAE